MESSVLAIGLATAAFAATNVDDIFILVAFLADPAARPVRVFLGQYLGIGALYAASVACSLVCVVLPSAYVGLLGLVPIAIGALKIRQGWRGHRDSRDEGAAIHRASGQILAVSSVTIANSGDNVGIYTPLFAIRAADEVALFGVVFAVMTALWCLAAHWLVNHGTAGAPIRRHARRVVPFVLMSLGVLILYDAGTLDLLRD